MHDQFMLQRIVVFFFIVQYSGHVPESPHEFSHTLRYGDFLVSGVEFALRPLQRQPERFSAQRP